MTDTAAAEQLPSTIGAALALAQAEMHNAPLNKVNPHFKNRYADLAAIRDATIPILAKHGIAVTQPMAYRDGQFVLLTRFIFGDQSIESVYPLPAATDKPQIMGSALTYARRYSLAAMCGISADDDDDAEAAQDGAKKTPDEVVAKRRDTAEQRAADKPPWQGPLKVTELKAEMNDMKAKLDKATSEDDVTVIMDEYAQVRAQCQHDLPDWHSASSEHINRLLNGFLEGETLRAG